MSLHFSGARTSRTVPYQAHRQTTETCDRKHPSQLPSPYSISAYPPLLRYTLGWIGPRQDPSIRRVISTWMQTPAMSTTSSPRIGTFPSSYQIRTILIHRRSFFCQLEDYIPMESESDYLEDLCREGTGARTITLAVAVLSSFVLYGVIYRTYQRSKQAKASGPVTYEPQRAQSVMSTASTIVVGDEKHTPISDK